MTRKLLLILTGDNRKATDFTKSPFLLAPEDYRATAPENLIYMGLNSFAAIIIDSQNLISALRKVSLGIRDEPATEGLWNLFSGTYNIPVYVLTERRAVASRPMKDLGMEFITGNEIKNISGSADSFNSLSEAEAKEPVITADEIRQMYQNGAKRIPADVKLTNWAAEVADSLEMSQNKKEIYSLVNLANLTATEIQNIEASILEITKIPLAFFVISPVIMPKFITRFPSLRKKVVSSTVHWAEKGAFTGETAPAMLYELGCYGAIVPAKEPYKKNLKTLVNLASHYGLQLFSTFTLANNGGCDIIASDDSILKPLIPVYPPEALKDQGSLMGSYAVIADYRYFKDNLL